MILVGGESTDGTVTVARDMLPRIRIVQQHGPHKGSALRTGFSASSGEIILMLEADERDGTTRDSDVRPCAPTWRESR